MLYGKGMMKVSIMSLVLWLLREMKNAGDVCFRRRDDPENWLVASKLWCHVAGEQATQASDAVRADVVLTSS